MPDTINHTHALARFIATLDFETLPDDLLTRGRLSILDALGCGLAGSVSDGAQILQHYLGQYRTADGASVIGTALHLPPPFAALANGQAMHADDYDDTLRSHPASGYHGSTHPTGPIVAALLAIAERQGCSGREWVTAYHAGVEAMAKINDALGERHFHSGFHPTATLSVFGAAAAASRLLGLSTDQTVTALGIAGSQAAGLRQNFGSMMKPFHPGHGAMDGLMAAELAAAGFTASDDILGASRGFFRAYGDDFDSAPIAEKLGNPWSFVEPGMWLKPFPSGMRTHPAMSQLPGILAKHQITPAAIRTLQVRTNAGVYNTLLHHNPQTGLQGKFSMEFCLAKIVLDGTAGLADFTDDVVQRRDIRAMMARIVYDTYAESEAVEQGYTTVTTLLTFALTDGRTLTERVDYGKGSQDDPMHYGDVADKVRECAAYRGWPADKTAVLITLVAHLEELESVAPLLAALTES
jgi:2-methylcitrate dehydratase PrpD